MAGENIRELLKAEENKRVSLPAAKNDTRKAAWGATSYKDRVPRKHNPPPAPAAAEQ